MIDWRATHRKVIAILRSELLPWHYRQLYHKAVAQCPGDYSEKTDPAEKLRQYYAEHPRRDVGFVSDGFLVLREWFPEIQQLSMFPPDRPQIIRGNCLVSYEAGYEQALRQPHMFDHFKDANTPSRSERRRRAALVEAHIKHYFKAAYPEFYEPPSNHKQYDRPAKEDFFLRLNTGLLPIDVKSWSYENQEGREIGVARNPDDKIIYLWADWQDDETVIMSGICNGAWLKAIGESNNGLVHIGDNLIWPIDCLLVILNMERADMSYADFKKRLQPYIMAKAA